MNYKLHIVQDYKLWYILTYWMFTRICDKHFLKVWTAYGQHNFVRLQQFTVTGQCDIDQIATIVQILKSGSDVILEIVPTQCKFVVHCLSNCTETANQNNLHSIFRGAPLKKVCALISKLFSSTFFQI